jgi:hypothetical protein
LQIIVEPHLMRLSESGTIVGPIWLRSKEAPDIVFPEAEWSDFPVVILGWWLREVESLLRGAAVEATCLFMDGPFEFSINRSGDVQFRQRRKSGHVAVGPSTLRISADEFWMALLTSALNVVAECDARGWSNVDIDDLRRFIV